MIRIGNFAARSLALALLCCARTPAPGRAGEAERLASPLVLTDGQQGVAGETGTVTTIAPDGTFTVARYVGKAVDRPERTGRLGPDALGRLARALDEELAPPLPDRIGAAGPANPRQVKVHYRGSAVSLTLPPGASLDEGSAVPPALAGTPAAHVLRLRRLVNELVERPAG